MKNIYILIIILLVSSCNKTDQKNTTNSEPFLIKNIELLKTNNYTTPIKTFINYANKNAKEAITIKKNNIKSALKKAKKHRYSAIVVGTHTIVKLIDFDDCKESGKWGTCMPKAEGYIKKGSLNYKKDYVNNIIGIPDNQERKLYLFE